MSNRQSSTRPGHINTSIKLYADYESWLENRFLELIGTCVALTLKDSLSVPSSGMLQIYDTKSLHTLLSGREIIQVSVQSGSTGKTYNRIYGIKNIAVGVDNKADNIITLELGSIHRVRNDKFSRSFFPDAVDTLKEMLRVIYMDEPKLEPEVTGKATHVPKVPWLYGITEYMDFIREFGISTDANSFSFVWEDFTGIRVEDFEYLVEQEPLPLVYIDPDTIGEFVTQMPMGSCFDFSWETKANPYVRDPLLNATFVAYSMLDKGSPRVTTGDGRNSVLVSRSGGYATQMFRNPYEEATRIQTMAQYDGYAKFRTYGEPEIMPGQKIIIKDLKDQFKTYFYVDTVIHEITSDMTMTHIYAFTNSLKLEEISNEKITNNLESN